MKSVFFSDEEYEQLANEVEQLVSQLESLPYPNVKEYIHDLMQKFDLLHREALSRLVRQINEKHPELQEQMQEDKAIRVLFSLYDLVRTDIQDAGSTVMTTEELFSSNGYPIWIPAGTTEELEEGKLYTRQLEGEDILVCRISGEIYGLQNNCVGSVLPLDSGKLENGVLFCPWHGCKYDVATGLKVGSSSQKLRKYPVLLADDGKFRIGLNN